MAIRPPPTAPVEALGMVSLVARQAMGGDGAVARERGEIVREVQARAE